MDEKFISEIRQHVNGKQTTQIGKRTKKFGKRSIGVLAVLIAGALVVSAGLLLMFGAMRQDIITQASITLDGDGTGELQTLVPVTDAYGGDIIRSEHVLESHSDSYIMVDMEQEILEDAVPITENEIVSALYDVTGATGTMEFGTGDNTLTRQANTIDYAWTQGFAGAQTRGILLILVFEGANYEKIQYDYATTSWHWYSWEITGWSASHTLTEGVRDTTSGIMVSSPDGNSKKISILYDNVPDVFSWGWYGQTNSATQLHVPADWTGDGDVTHVVEDGCSFTELTFPYLMSPHEELNFVWRIELNPLITPSEYSVQVDFIPEP